MDVDPATRRLLIDTLALIPARGGSKGLPGKNLAPVGGLSLVARAVAVALQVPRIDTIVVSSDADDILREAAAAGARAERRPDDLSSDTASIEDVIAHVLRDLPEVATVVVLQPTSPLREPVDLERCLDLVAESGACVATVTALAHPVHWVVHLDEVGALVPVLGWDGFARRRQELAVSYQLNGAVYAAPADHLRAGGRLVTAGTLGVEMPSARSVDIDSSADLELARAMLRVADGQRPAP